MPFDTLTRRRLSVADLPDVLALLTASDRAVLGHTDFTETEVAADLRRADLQAYGWYAGTDLVGYGWVAQAPGAQRVDLDAYVHPAYGPDAATVGAHILAYLEQRGVALVAAAGHPEAIFDLGAYRQDERTRAWLAARDFTAGTTFVRMRVDFTGPVAAAGAPAEGVVVRRATRSTEDLRAAYTIGEESFLDHYSNVPVSFDTWLQRLDECGEDWSELWLADVDGEPAGVLVATRQFVEDENAGYVRTLGTLPRARGRGAATALLRHYFAEAAAGGRDAVLLHVDVSNVTGALRLYEAVGMRAVLTIDAWTKRVAAPAPAPAPGSSPAPAAAEPRSG